MQEFEGSKAKLSIAFSEAQNLWEPFIEKIVFFKYKRIRDQESLSFTYPVTALVGKNGSNKSSILHALYGAPTNFSPGHFWFSTSLDPIDDAGLRPRFYYEFRIHALNVTAQVRKMMFKAKSHGTKAGKKINDPDYWEPTQPALRDGMNRFSRPDGSEAFSSLDRWNPITKHVVYLDLRSDLSVFDRIYYTHLDDSRIKAKKWIRRITKPLKKSLESMVTTQKWHRKERILANVSFTSDMIGAVNYILGQDYSSVKYIEHSFFGISGFTFMFSGISDYSDAFAGRGESSVARMIYRIYTAPAKSLILLDEPETSLHIEAQQRLINVLMKRALGEKHQIVVATHSPFMTERLPKHAVKVSIPQSDGSVVLLNEASSADSVFHLGGQIPQESVITVFVEDRLSKYIVEQACKRLTQSKQEQITISVLAGGADTIRSQFMPVHMETAENRKFFYFLDGDVKPPERDSQLVAYPSSDAIPSSKNKQLDELVNTITGVVPKYSLDGNSGAADQEAKFLTQRRFYDFSKQRLRFLPFDNPETLLISLTEHEHEELLKGVGNAKEKMAKIVSHTVGDESLVNSDSIHLTCCTLWNKNSEKCAQVTQEIVDEINAMFD